MIPALRFHEILSLDDLLYDEWLDLYQSAFPPNEQMLVSAHNRVLRDKKHGVSDDQHLVAAVDGPGTVVGMVRYDLQRACSAAALWYLAVRRDARNEGMGSTLYREIVQRVRSEEPAIRALVFEVEHPNATHSPAERELAFRRIAFYQRNGARLMGGIDYVQSVGWQEPVPMHLMVHGLTPALHAGEALQLVKCVFGSALQEVGPPVLE